MKINVDAFTAYFFLADLSWFLHVGWIFQEEFQNEVMKRGGDFRDTVYCFGFEEGETYTLCRWLRARKFDLAETIKMVEEATVVRSEPRKCNFFPGKSFFSLVYMSLYVALVEFYPRSFYSFLNCFFP